MRDVLVVEQAQGLKVFGAEDDLHEAFELVSAFIEEAKIEAMTDQTEPIIRMLLKIGAGAAFGWYRERRLVGVCMVTISPRLFGPGLQAEDVVWYVLPDFRNGPIGIRLLRAAETWCREKGARVFFLGHMESANFEHLKDLYERLGYTRCGWVYKKEL